MADPPKSLSGEPRPTVFELRRREMVRDQLQVRGIKDDRVLRAMALVPREEFVAPEYQNEAYDDTPLPIGHGQTISQPYTVAYMTEALALEGTEKVLEVGTGSGYQAAVLAHLARTVHSVERIAALGRQAEEVLDRLGYDNVHVHLINGTLGLPAEAPFDAILVAASSSTLPEPYRDQIADGGRIVIPLGPHSLAQRLYRFTLRNGKLESDDLGAFRFVPLIGKYGWGNDVDPPST
jgi:protein-L-isoaspartate(D-aspartate) O-methyltransferase